MEEVNKIDDVDLKMLARYIEKRSTKTIETLHAHQPFQRETIDSPTTSRSSRISRRKSLTITSKNLEHGTYNSNAQMTPRTQISSTTIPRHAICIGSYDIGVEYNMVSGKIHRLDSGKFFVKRFKESCLQLVKDHLHFTFSKIPMHLQKAIIHDMDTEFGVGWSIKKVTLQIS